MGLVRQELGLSKTQQRFPLKGTCLAIYSRVRQQPGAAGQVLQQRFPWCAGWEAELKRLFGAYVAEKQQQHVLDYDDLLLYWRQMMDEPALARELGARFEHVLVDEYQDTNRLQAEILLALKPDGRGLTVVGDDAQSIYSFRAAEVRNILDFPPQFEPAGAVVTLQRNYRSTQPILRRLQRRDRAGARALCQEAVERPRRRQRPQLVSVRDEAEQAAGWPTRCCGSARGGLALKRQAVLFRTSHHSAALELELVRRNIPFVKFGGLKFLEAAHVKDLLSMLRWAQNPRSRMAGFRVAQLVRASARPAARRLLGRDGAGRRPGRGAAGVQAAARARPRAWQRAARLPAGDARQRHRPGPPHRPGACSWYLPQLQRLHEDAPCAAADLAQLARLAAGYATRERFLTELTLDPPEATSDEAGAPHLDEDYLILSTIHSAKGQEWDAVYVLNVVDGCMPSDMATGSAAELEEERRLLYVAMTRAQHHLHLLVPQRFYVTQQAARGDRHVYGALSRFIPPQVAAHFEHTCAAGPDGDACIGQAPDGARSSTSPLRVRSSGTETARRATNARSKRGQRNGPEPGATGQRKGIDQPIHHHRRALDQEHLRQRAAPAQHQPAAQRRHGQAQQMLASTGHSSRPAPCDAKYSTRPRPKKP